MPATLDITGGGLPPRTVELSPGTTTLGRADSNAIVLNHPNVSRSHLEIRLDANGAQIVDLNSVNGTRVNDTKLEPHAWQHLNPGDVIEIGPFQATYAAEADSGATVVMSRTVAMPRTPTPEPVVPPPASAEPVQVAPPVEPPPIESPAWREPDPVAAAEPPWTPDTYIAPAPEYAHEQMRPAAQQYEYEAPPAQAYAPQRQGAPRASRDSLALLLLVVAIILSLPASFAVWNERVLNNEDQFVKLGHKALSEPAVQRELARQLAADLDTTSENLLRGIVPPEVQRDLEQVGRQILDSLLGTRSTPTSASPTGQPAGFTEQLMLDIVRTLPNTPVADAALRTTHQALQTALRDQSIRANDGAIVLDVSGGTSDLFNIAGIPGVTPTALSPGWGRVEITRNPDTVRAIQVLRFIDGKAIIFIVAVLAALVAGLYFAGDRARYTRLAGLAFAGSAVLWIVLAKAPFKPLLVQDRGGTASAKAASDAIYDVAANSFVNQELIVAGVGAALFALGLYMSSRATHAEYPPQAPTADA